MKRSIIHSVTVYLGFHVRLSGTFSTLWLFCSNVYLLCTTGLLVLELQNSMHFVLMRFYWCNINANKNASVRRHLVWICIYKWKSHILPQLLQQIDISFSKRILCQKNSINTASLRVFVLWGHTGNTYRQRIQTTHTDKLFGLSSTYYVVNWE